MKRFVTTDLHGNFKALKQCIEKSKIDFKKDKLIVLGDTCDGLPQVKECFDELLKFKNLVYIMGNHDLFAYEWYTKDIFNNGVPELVWTSQGGQKTIESYGGINKMMDGQHLKLLKEASYYHIEHFNNDTYLFVHGGINPNQKNMEKQDKDLLIWDRDLIHNAYFKHYQKPNYKYGDFTRIYVGHTTTQIYKTLNPLTFCNVIMLDTGAGWSGKLTIMDIDTDEFWQSDIVEDLYPEYKGR